MTKIMSLVSAGFACQVADRLVSIGGRPFDRLANKTLIYVARDAIAFMSYTGSAYLEGIPTDEWLARTLTGVHGEPPTISAGAIGWMGTRMGALPQWFDIGQAAQLLAKELESIRPLLVTGDYPPVVLISGVQWKRSRPTVWHGFLGTVRTSVNLGGYGAFFPSVKKSRQSYLMFEIPMPSSFTPAERANVHVGLQGATEPERVEDRLVEAVRLASSREPGVIGDDVLSLSISSAAPDSIRVRFHSRGQWSMATHQFPRKKGDFMDVAFGPWIITPAAVVAPQAMMGESEFELVFPIGKKTSRRLRIVPLGVPGPRPGAHILAYSGTAPRMINPNRQRRRAR